MTAFTSFAFAATGGLTPRSMPDRLGHILNVKDFGATGNGSTDDGPAIQLALNAIRTTGTARALYFPAGTYLTNQVLYVTNTTGVLIFGDGCLSTVINYRGSVSAGNTEVANGITPVIMTNGFSYSALSGIRLNIGPGANAVGIYYYQDGTASKGTTEQLRVSDMLVDGGCFTGYLMGYQASALCSEIMHTNCAVNSCTGYGFRNASSNALNNNLFNCTGVGNAVWLSCPTGKVDVFGASLAVNTIDIVVGQNPMVVQGARTEGFAFVDAGSAGLCPAVTLIGCVQEPHDAATASYFVNIQNSTLVNMIGCDIGSNISTQGKILGDSYLISNGNYFRNAAPFSSFTGSIRSYQSHQNVGTVASLPTAAACFKGVRMYVTDSTVAASGNFGATVAGGGTNVVPVWCDGSAWKIG
jgi:hypothetical protein